MLMFNNKIGYANVSSVKCLVTHVGIFNPLFDEYMCSPYFAILTFIFVQYTPPCSNRIKYLRLM